MATVASFANCQSEVISLLQAAQNTAAWPTLPDGTKRQYASPAEIDNSILTVDGEICTLICNTLGHPYQSQFALTTVALQTGTLGITLPIRNGMLLKVMCNSASNDLTGVTWSDTTDILTKTNHGLSTGTPVQWTTTLAPVGGGFAINTNYYVIYISANTFYLATTPYNAYNGTYIDISAVAAGGTNTLVPQYIEAFKGKSADEIKELMQYATLFGFDPTSNTKPNYFFIEGDILFCSATYTKIVYTDYTLTATTQAPQPYFWAIVAGAVGKLLKDGGDGEMASYYLKIYESMKAEIAGLAQVIPAFESYTYGRAA